MKMNQPKHPTIRATLGGLETIECHGPNRRRLRHDSGHRCTFYCCPYCHGNMLDLELHTWSCSVNDAPPCRYCDRPISERKGHDETAPPEHMSAGDWHGHARCVEGREPLYVR